MVTEHAAWSERTAAWIPTVMDANKPLLGICYGHQLIAYALGGEVGPNPRGREFGTVEIVLREAARADRLFAGLPSKILAHASHAQSVLRLPPGATWLASSDRDPHHAFAVGRSTWGVQFHPEFGEGAAKAYVDKCTDELRAQGDDPTHLRNSIAETPHAEAMLKRFASLV
jgi:GMP synthase (glutamine-hydrolysing)